MNDFGPMFRVDYYPEINFSKLLETTTFSQIQYELRVGLLFLF